jgi:hypothetical protein
LVDVDVVGFIDGDDGVDGVGGFGGVEICG